MQALIQRVSRASVSIEGDVAGKIGPGYVVLLGVRAGDTEDDALYLAHRTVNLRIFPDDDDRMNLSIQDKQGEILVISQFTLCADTRKGSRPSFVHAAQPETAKILYQVYVDALRRELGDSRVACGVFGAKMLVEILNDGPVTLKIRSRSERERG